MPGRTDTVPHQLLGYFSEMDMNNAHSLSHQQAGHVTSVQAFEFSSPVSLHAPRDESKTDGRHLLEQQTSEVDGDWDSGQAACPIEEVEDDGSAMQELLSNIGLTDFEQNSHSSTEERQTKTVKRINGLRRRYLHAPQVIRKGWAILIPAIIELSYHTLPQGKTLIQTLRHIKTMKKRGRVGQASYEAYLARIPKGYVGVQAKRLDDWLHDLLVPMGSLPVDAIDDDPKLVARKVRARQKQASASVSPAHKFIENLSIPCRFESMMCLEMLVAKAWWDRCKRSLTREQVAKKILDALEFMYWECGIPTVYDAICDDQPELWDPIFESVRRHNYRQLYDAASSGELEHLKARVNEGIQVLQSHRREFAPRYRRENRNDVRWTYDFSAYAEIIKEKYAIKNGADQLGEQKVIRVPARAHLNRKSAHQGA